MSETPQLFRLWRGSRVHRTEYLWHNTLLVALCGSVEALVNALEEHDERGVPTDVTCKQCLKRNPST